MSLLKEVERLLASHVQPYRVRAATRDVLQRVRDSVQIRQPYSAAQVYKLLDDALKEADA